MHLGFARADYMASIISYSGGNPVQAQSQDPTNHFSSILTYGDQGTDVVVVDFNLPGASLRGLAGAVRERCSRRLPYILRQHPHVIPHHRLFGIRNARM